MCSLSETRGSIIRLTPASRAVSTAVAASRREPRPGTTLVELLILLALTGALAGVALRSGAALLDATAVTLAGRRVAELLALARDQAVARGERTAVRFGAGDSRVVVHVGADTVARVDLRALGGVGLAATRDSMAYGPSGLGYGAANLRLVLSRGASADTITISRLGRVRR